MKKEIQYIILITILVIIFSIPVIISSFNDNKGIDGDDIIIVEYEPITDVTNYEANENNINKIYEAEQSINIEILK